MKQRTKSNYLYLASAIFALAFAAAPAYAACQVGPSGFLFEEAGGGCELDYNALYPALEGDIVFGDANTGYITEAVITYLSEVGTNVTSITGPGQLSEELVDDAITRDSEADDIALGVCLANNGDTSTSGDYSFAGEVTIGGVSSDGAGRVYCVKSNGQTGSAPVTLGLVGNCA